MSGLPIQLSLQSLFGSCETAGMKMAKTNPKHPAVKRRIFDSLQIVFSEYCRVSKGNVSSSSRGATDNCHSVSRGIVHTSGNEDSTQLRL
jgi:hypothetical protein